MSHHTAYTMSGLCAVGGVMGYMKRGSRPSLVAGLGIGALYGLSGYLLQQNADYGTELALATSAVLTTAMGSRAMRTRQPVPAAVATAGLLTAVYYGRKWYEYTYGV
ncbi:hypothetical protein RI367_005924 [Sorochytrium milnesiophthora]